MGQKSLCLHGHFKMSLIFTQVYRCPQPLNHCRCGQNEVYLSFATVAKDCKAEWEKKTGVAGSPRTFYLGCRALLHHKRSPGEMTGAKGVPMKSLLNSPW